MTALCPGGGPSGPLPNVQNFVSYDAGALGALVGAELGPAGEILLGMLAANIGIIATQAFCSTDPPADPGITVADIANATNWSAPNLSLPAIARLAQWVEHQLWFKLCGCTGAATPAAPAPSNPGVTVGQNTGLPPAQIAGPCWSTSAVVDFPAQTAVLNAPAFDLTSRVFPALAPTFAVQTPSVPAITLIAQTIPANANLITMSLRMTSTSGLGGEEFSVLVDGWDAVGTRIPGNNVSVASSGAGQPTVTFSIPPPAVYWTAYSANTSAAAQGVLDLSYTCTGTPSGQLVQPCCPPDPTLNSMLQQIIGMDQYIINHLGTGAVVEPPFTAGIAHAGLSGTGTLVFTGAPRAVRVDVVSSVQQFIVNPGSPDYYFSMGFITSYAESTPLKGWRLVYTGQIYPIIPQATEVGWTLPPGLIVNITELL